jgi:lipase ATG15
MTSATCETPGWFGCHDSTTSTVSQTAPPALPSSCHTPGYFWGCYDQVTTSSHPITAPP